MNYTLSYTTKFLHDVKVAKKRGLNLQLLKNVTDILQTGNALPPQNHDHALIGNYKGYRECHITPDWLLIYKKDVELKIIALHRTGSHSDLFKK